MMEIRRFTTLARLGFGTTCFKISHYKFVQGLHDRVTSNNKGWAPLTQYVPILGICVAQFWKRDYSNCWRRKKKTHTHTYTHTKMHHCNKGEIHWIVYNCPLAKAIFILQNRNISFRLYKRICMNSILIIISGKAYRLAQILKII